MSRRNPRKRARRKRQEALYEVEHALSTNSLKATEEAIIHYKSLVRRHRAQGALRNV